MRILMVAPQPFFEPRGTPISVFQRLHGLSKLGHEVDLITYHVGQSVDIPGVTIHRAPAIPFIKKVKIGPSPAKIPLDIMLVFMTLYMLLRRRYDALHSHEEAAFWCALFAPLFRVPHIYDMHSSLPKQLQNFKFGNHPFFIGIFDRLERWVINTADVVLTIGRDLEETVLEIKPDANHIRIENTAAQNNISVDPQAAEALRQRLGLQDKVAIVYTGTFETYQGLDLLFESVKLLKARADGFTVVMVGGKPEQVEQQKAEARRLGIEDVVLFVGTVPLAESLVYLEMADFLVSPRSSGLSVPLKIYTYLQSGRAIVATRLPAHTLVLTEEISVLADPEPAAYAEGMHKLVEDAALRDQISQAALVFAQEELSESKYLEKLTLACESVRLSRRIELLQRATE